jgi:hypothetical protein
VNRINEQAQFLYFDFREFVKSEPVVDPLGCVIKEVLSRVGALRKRFRAVRASADAGRL